MCNNCSFLISFDGPKALKHCNLMLFFFGEQYVVLMMTLGSPPQSVYWPSLTWSGGTWPCHHCWWDGHGRRAGLHDRTGGRSACCHGSRPHQPAECLQGRWFLCQWIKGGSCDWEVKRVCGPLHLAYKELKFCKQVNCINNLVQTFAENFFSRTKLCPNLLNIYLHYCTRMPLVCFIFTLRFPIKFGNFPLTYATTGYQDTYPAHTWTSP